MGLRADVDPVAVSGGGGAAGAAAGGAGSGKTDWTQVGGLDSHVRALQEMIVLPLLYPELFDKFNIAPPRGPCVWARARCLSPSPPLFA